MRTLDNTAQQFYSESDAAMALGVSIARLHMLLDAHIFNDGSQRPAALTFTGSDLALLEFWQKSTPNAKVIRMPRR